MHVKISENHVRDGWRDFLRRNLRFLVLYPAIALALIVVQWSAISTKLENDKRLLEDQALKQAASIAGTYAQYLTRTVEQLDQLSKQIKYGWEQSDGHWNFLDMADKGLLDIP